MIQVYPENISTYHAIREAVSYTHLDVYKRQQERITGRYLCENIVDKDGNVLVKANHMVTPKRAELIMKKGVDEKGQPLTKIKIRTILTCRSHSGVCAKCYGANMATGEPVQVGDCLLYTARCV